MTWQRIDENTYIDDNLVTCAEYQLFIDEMREQGKYCQPDHWLSYQFPAGQARDPILGVRFSDGLAFCDWLSKRENGKAKYRPPTSSEAMSSPLKPYKQELTGYWLNKDFEFAWIDAEEPKNVKVDKNIPSEREEYSANMRVIIIDSAAFKPTGNTSVDKDLDELQITFDNIRSLTTNRNDHFKHALRIMSKLHRNVTGFTFKDLFQEDILILQERIAGRYPPYEGIRLVKQVMR